MCLTPQLICGRSARRYLRFWGPDVPADVDDELAFHLEMRAREYEAGGLSPDDARRTARGARCAARLDPVVTLRGD